MADDEQSVGRLEKEDINDHVHRLLRDLGWPEPPLSLDQVRELQKLDLSYYSKSDLDLLDEMAHRARMAGGTIMNTAKRMREVVSQFGLRGLLMLKENDKKIFIDDDVVLPKRRFIIGHEIIHDLLPWHRSLLLGDNEATLSPTCHQIMEAEANYGSRQLIFMGKKFQEEARDNEFSWKVVTALKARYGNTLTTTLWQMICERDPSHPVFGMISTHPNCPEIGARGDGERVAYFIQSDGFRMRFSNVGEADAYCAMSSYATNKRRGPVGQEVRVFNDVNGDAHDFDMFSFSNGYDLLTYGFYLGPHRTLVSIQ